VDPYLYFCLRFIVCTEIIPFTLRFVGVAHALTTAAETVHQTREPCRRPSRGLCSPEVRADDLMTCCFVSGHSGVPSVTTGGSQVRCHELRQKGGQLRVVWGKAAGRWQEPRHTVGCYHLVTSSKPGFGISQSVR
jgi:hypothetical protein